MANSFAVARLSNVAGIVPTFTLHPDKLSARVKKAAQRMLLNGALKGGWRSQARKVALVTAGVHDLPLLSLRWERYLDVPGTAPEQVRNGIADQLRADLALCLLRIEERMLTYAHQTWYQEQMKERKTEVAGMLEHLYAGRSVTVVFDESEYGHQALQFLADEYRPRYAKMAAEVAAKLDSADPIMIPERLIGAV